MSRTPEKYIPYGIVLPNQPVATTDRIFLGDTPNIDISKPKPHFLRLAVPGRPTDILIPTERFITTQDFLTDNLNERRKAENGKIGKWQINYQNGEMYIRIGCSDARPIYDEEKVWNQRSIAGGSSYREGFVETFIHENIKGIVVDTHYGKFELGKRPEGCGGQDTKAKIKAGKIEAQPDHATGFCDEHVHEDPIIQGVIQARGVLKHLIARHESGRIFVTTQQHHTGKIVPVAEFNIVNGNLESGSILPVLMPFLVAETKAQQEAAYNPAVIYAEGIPQLPEEELSDEFKEYLAIADAKMLKTQEEHPNLSERQEVQNPWALVISTNKIPIQDRYPTLFGDIGTAFEVDIPRTKSKDGITISQHAINEAVKQMQYAMEHAVNPDDPSFSNSKVLFIETGDIEQSLRIAEHLAKKEWAKKWIDWGGRVIIAETHGVITSKVEELEPVLQNLRRPS